MKDHMMEEQIHTEKHIETEQELWNLETVERYMDSLQNALLLYKKKYTRISVMRLLFFMLIVFGVLVIWILRAWWGWLPAVGSGFGFVGLLCCHAEVNLRMDAIEQLLRVCERYRLRFLGTWQELPDTGAEFLTKEDTVAADLDVFGESSLYQLICTAHTQYGRRRLAEVLRQADELPDARRKRQKAVEELSHDHRFALRFESTALHVDEELPKSRSVEQKTPAKPLQIVAWVYPFLFLGSMVGMFLGIIPYGVSLSLFFAALLFSWICSGYCQSCTGMLFQQARSTKTYLRMMEQFAGEAFHADHLKELQETIVGTEKKDGLIGGMRKMERILSAYQIRYNPVIHWLLSGICLYDIHLAGAAAAWERRYGDRLNKGIEALGELEMLLSLSTLARVREVSYPELLDTQEPVLHMEGITHPLLMPEQAVANDISLRKQTVIITGSNMSGKTTFLRTIGLNLILAYAGAPVCGHSVSASFMRIFTSMRVTDDVKHGISTFYAEILRIKDMVEFAKTTKPMLCLIDEIFKGTNSADRIVGAKAVIRRLTGPYMITIVSTHDFELCNLAENYHFEETYQDDRICFDYCLKRGICTTTNALYLLKMAGLTETEEI